MKDNKLTYEITVDGKAKDGRDITVKAQRYEDRIAEVEGLDYHLRLVFSEKESGLRLGQTVYLDEELEIMEEKMTDVVNHLDEFLLCLS